jgi:5-formyltetrahydrofolate cyclo-ligase
MKNISFEKALLRKKILEVRKKISEPIRRKKSKHIYQKLLRDSHFCKAEHVAFYYGIRPEVETRSFLKKILDSKKIYLPKVVSMKKTLTFHKIVSIPADLRKGAYAIMEPKAKCPERNPARMDLIVVPGVAFDKTGKRLGRSGGYYDRVLHRAKKVYKIGVCFREQIVKKVPVTKHDIDVDKVITD